MGKVEALEKEVESLSESELTEFRAWYETFDANRWDKKLESDIASGKLDVLADTALGEHAEGKSTPL